MIINKVKIKRPTYYEYINRQSDMIQRYLHFLQFPLSVPEKTKITKEIARLQDEITYLKRATKNHSEEKVKFKKLTITSNLNE